MPYGHHRNHRWLSQVWAQPVLKNRPYCISVASGGLPMGLTSGNSFIQLHRCGSTPSFQNLRTDVVMQSLPRQECMGLREFTCTPHPPPNHIIKSCQDLISVISCHRNDFRITDPLWVNPPVTDGFSSQKASNGDISCTFDFSWTCCWSNSRVAGNWRSCHCVMSLYRKPAAWTF